ncbi:MAG: DoxX family protein [Acidobacteria bacterium]|nr:DoxX family protein [Acidobacteriota bacterium]MDW7983509.1 DoxX family protein [Acidobacteriota bacterium]
MAVSNSSSVLAGPALIRLSAGLLLAFLHGWPKVLAAYGYFVHGQEWRFIKIVEDIGFPAPVLFATLSTLTEFVGGFLLAVGLFTRYVAFFVLFNMAVAIYRNAMRGSLDELALMYAIIALAFLIYGGGAFSLDARLRKSSE